jgi:phage/conjugal plasmid C-4 type zinc finger TraR family protein
MIDEAQQLADDRRADALAAHRMRAAPTTPGPGICIDCGCAIEAERLTACPTARRCLDCQERHERTR